ncbi:MAG: HAMP domain-containing protein [Candidatus Thiodiazotropha sp. (ex Troendleina suluensis)]|nr:HAMP domain-containing protein [Candidatus Thiodiazotropha sp. (ex Troendleina suluensis)]
MNKLLSDNMELDTDSRSWWASSSFHTLRARLIISVALVHMVLMSLFTWEAVDRQSQELRNALVHQGDSLASLMVVATTNALLAEDLASLAEVTRRIDSLANVEYGEIVDVRGFVLASTIEGRVGKRTFRNNKRSESFPLSNGDQVLQVSEDVLINDRAVGYVTLGLSTENLKQELVATRNQGVLYILLALVIGSIVAWMLSVAVTRNLQELTIAAEDIGRGNFEVKVKERGRDEVSTLAQAFNLMVVSLQKHTAEIEREQKKRNEAEHLACVGEMAASIAHEIRNPMSSLINSVKLLGNPKLAESDHVEVVGIVNKETHRLQRILNEFLAYARLPESVILKGDVTPLIKETLELMKSDPVCTQSMTVDFCFEDKVDCLFDPDQIRQVLLNLMLNALQAMDSDGHLSIKVKRHDDLLNICLVDDGCGIQPKMIQEITKPFVSTRKGGSGLGLSVVLRILVQHGTTLYIESEPNVRTEISFDLKILNG